MRAASVSFCANKVVAGEAGFGIALSLRQHFQANLQTSPSSYHRQFRAGQGSAGV
jgi:transcriptional regulator GlxA family with amidase domain